MNLLRSQVLYWRRCLLLLCLAASFVAAVGAWFEPTAFLRAYLLGYLICASIPLGCLGLLSLHQLVGGAWGEGGRIYFEGAVWTFPLTGALIVPLLIGASQIYPWAQSHESSVPLTDQHGIQTAYLNLPFFVVRTVLYFAIWIGLAWLLVNRDGGRLHFPALRWAPGFGIPVYVLSATFAAIDWIMSLEPHWHSTVFGLLFIAGNALAALAGLILYLRFASRFCAQTTPVSVKAAHDLGNLLLAFVLLWVYLAFVQFLITWSGNLRQEIPWYVRRSAGFWPWLALGLALFHFAIPFGLLLLRPLKQRLSALAGVAALILAMRLADIVWQIGPDPRPNASSVHWLNLAVPAALAAFWLAEFMRQILKMDSGQTPRAAL